MYSMSVLNLAKFQEVAISIRSGFGGIVKGGGEQILPNLKGKPTIRSMDDNNNGTSMLGQFREAERFRGDAWF